MRIETATIRRLRDALLRSGRPADVLSPAFETLARAGILSEAEKTALARIDPMIETLFLMMAADGKVTETERAAVRGAVRGLTGDLLHDGTVKVMLETYEKMLLDQGREARLQAVGQVLRAHPSDAEGAFALAAAVALADDHVDEAERSLVSQIATWFGITEARAVSILNQVEEDKA